MNAKVQIQLSEQLIPFYSAADALNAYMLASEATAQLRTLINQISKSTAQIKAYAHDNNVSKAVFSELENLISVSKFLADSQADTYILECKKHREEPYDQYDAGDLLGAYSLSFETTSWLQTMLSQMKDEVTAVKEKSPQLSDAIFASLERLIHIAEYLADNHSNTFDVEREKYEMEWNKIGGDQND